MDSRQNTRRHPAVVLIGPTGAGKTPLGQLLESRGLWGRRCVHFDFGAQLRSVAAITQTDPQSNAAGPEEFTSQQIDFIRDVLARGALLEDQHFPLAKKILLRFLARSCPDSDTWVLLNGLPRHAGQAEKIAELLDVKAVIELRCTAEAVLERIRTNIGGDRMARQDDDIQSIAQRLATYHQRTAPLVEYYRKQGVPIVSVAVGPQTTAEQLWESVQRGPVDLPSGDAPGRSAATGTVRQHRQ